MDSPVLVDIKNGKKVDWQGLKRQANQLAVIYGKLADKFEDEDEMILAKKYRTKSEKVAQCNTSLLFGYNQGETKIDKKLVYCNNCHDRGCPLCNHKKSRVRAYQLNQILSSALKQYDNLGFIFVTFTIKNVENSPEALHEAILKLNKSFGKMVRYSRVIGKNGKNIEPKDRVIKGSMKNVEVTYNEKTDTLHPHIHALFAVDSKKYFSKKLNNYISKDEWAKLWEKALGVDYQPVIDVRKLHKNKKGMDGIQASILEISKYETKPADVLIGGYDLDKAMQVVFSMSEGLQNTRSFSLAGILKEIKQEIFGQKDLNDVSDDEMLNADGESEVDLQNCVFVQYRWSKLEQNYVEIEVESDLIAFIREKFGGRSTA